MERPMMVHFDLNKNASTATLAASKRPEKKKSVPKKLLKLRFLAIKFNCRS